MPDVLQFMGPQRVGHNLATGQRQQTPCNFFITEATPIQICYFHNSMLTERHFPWKYPFFSD